MQIVSSSEARNNLSKIIDISQQEPVTIQKQGRNASVLISIDEYERLTNYSVAAFQALCDNIGSKAQAKGLTKKELDKLINKD